MAGTPELALTSAQAEKLSAAVVQSIGKMIVLFRPQPEAEEKPEPDQPVRRQQTAGRAAGKKTRD